jgi:hypothetical protein
LVIQRDLLELLSGFFNWRLCEEVENPRNRTLIRVSSEAWVRCIREFGKVSSGRRLRKDILFRRAVPVHSEGGHWGFRTSGVLRGRRRQSRASCGPSRGSATSGTRKTPRARSGTSELLNHLVSLVTLFNQRALALGAPSPGMTREYSHVRPCICNEC